MNLMLAAALAWAAALPLRAPADAPFGRPDAVVDLATPEGAALVKATWRFSEAQLVDIEARAPGPDKKPSGPRIRSLDVVPHAGEAGFDDGAWAVLEPASLTERRGSGRVSFAWYRTRVVIPERIGNLSMTGTTVALEVVMDDYAEIWVNGKLPVVDGASGGPVVRGWGAANRVVLGRGVRPGQEFEVAIFGINGPISASPHNFIWVKSVTLDVYRQPGDGAVGSRVEVRRVSPALDAIVPREPVVEKLADGFLFTEGPVWHPDGYLLFSDPNANTIYRWSPDAGVAVHRVKSGYRGVDIGDYGQPGSNGLALDREGRLTINEHGNRRVTRIEKNGVVTVLADGYFGKRLNSPNDLVYRSDGTLYFTDPPFGLPKFFEDPRKELPFSGIFAVKDGQVRLVAKDLSGPNGIVFSRDEKLLYVGNWDPARKVIMRYDVRPDGSLGPGRVFFDMTGAKGEEALDGLEIDLRGNIYASGPGGLWIIDPSGRHLGTLELEQQPANFAWGDADGKSLYITARTALYRLRLSVEGARR